MNSLSTEEVLRIIGWLCVIMLLLLVSLYVYLALRKSTYNKRKAAVYEIQRELEMPDSVLEQYLQTGEASRRLSTKEPYRMEAVQEALQHRQAVSSIPEERERIYTFADRYFTDYYRSQLKSSRWSIRMNTLLWVEQFRISSLEQDLIEWMNHPKCSEEEHFQILRILSKLNSASVIRILRDNDREMSDSQLLQILLPLEEELRAEILQDFAGFPYRVRCSFVDSLRINNIRSAEVLELLEQLLQQEDSELRIRSLKAISNFGYMSPEAIQRLLEVMEKEKDHPDMEAASWPERLMRAKVMGNVYEDVFVTYLVDMLGDSAYRVRQQAAESLSAYKNGLELLHKVAAGEHADRYAREMAEETLERKQYERNLA